MLCILQLLNSETMMQLLTETFHAVVAGIVTSIMS